MKPALVIFTLHVESMHIPMRPGLKFKFPGGSNKYVPHLFVGIELTLLEASRGDEAMDKR